MSLKDALARKRQRETFYDYVVGDPAELDEAEERLREAEQALRLATLREDKDATEAARASIEDARAVVRAHTERIVFRNMPPYDYEDLVAAHPPSKERAEKGDQWNARTFVPALLAACAVESGMTEAEWDEEIKSGRLNVADVDGMFYAALQANITPRSVTVPKG